MHIDQDVLGSKVVVSVFDHAALALSLTLRRVQHRRTVVAAARRPAGRGTRRTRFPTAAARDAPRAASCGGSAPRRRAPAAGRPWSAHSAAALPAQVLPPACCAGTCCGTYAAGRKSFFCHDFEIGTKQLWHLQL